MEVEMDMEMVEEMEMNVECGNGSIYALLYPSLMVFIFARFAYSHDFAHN